MTSRKQTIGDKAARGNFFEDFRAGQEIVHAGPRTLTEGDAALNLALSGSRFVVNSSREFARGLGLETTPIDDVLVFNVILGKTVTDISFNAVSNLGYADGRLDGFVYPGDTLRAASTVIGLREASSGQAGVVYVRTIGVNQREEVVASYVRWVLVRKRDPASAAPEPCVPELPPAVPAEAVVVPTALDLTAYDTVRAGGPYFWDDYAPGERIDHRDGLTIEEAEHMMLTRLSQNPAPIHFNAQLSADSRFGRRVVMGGHVIGLARSLTFNGFPNAFKVAAINAGRHTAPAFAGDTLHAWTEVLHKMVLPGRTDVGALRIRTLALKNRTCEEFPDRDGAGKYDPAVVLDLDYTVLVPRRA